MSLQQIKNQIEQKTLIDIHFKDDFGVFALYEQESGFYLEPAFLKSKKITKDIAEKFKALYTKKQEFNSDPEVIRTQLTYKEFLEKYYA